MENLHKVEGSKNQIELVKSDLWTGEVSEAIKYLEQQKVVGGNQFSNYLRKHRTRLINYHCLINYISYKCDFIGDRFYVLAKMGCSPLKLRNNP